MCKKTIITLTDGKVSIKDVETTEEPNDEENKFKDDYDDDFEDGKNEID